MIYNVRILKLYMETEVDFLFGVMLYSRVTFCHRLKLGFCVRSICVCSTRIETKLSRLITYIQDTSRNAFQKVSTHTHTELRKIFKFTPNRLLISFAKLKPNCSDVNVHKHTHFQFIIRCAMYDIIPT